MKNDDNHNVEELALQLHKIVRQLKTAGRTDLILSALGSDFNKPIFAVSQMYDRVTFKSVAVPIVKPLYALITWVQRYK